MGQQQTNQFQVETFPTFLRQQRPGPIMWLILISGLFVAGAGVAAEIALDGHIMLSPFLLLTGPIWYVGGTANYYNNYAKGRRQMEDQWTDSSLLVNDVRVAISNFDILSQTSPFPPQLGTPIYTFKYADVSLNPHSLVLCGKADELMKQGYFSPIVLRDASQAPEPHWARIVSVKAQEDGRTELVVEDPHYEKPIKLRFEADEQIAEWASGLDISELSSKDAA